jgi:hypothetical protein
MMNLANMKKKTRVNLVKAGALVATTFLVAAAPLFLVQRVFAADSSASPISIEKPEGWKQGDTKLSIMVDTSQIEVAKIEARVGQAGSWQDVTSSRSITISGNQTVYVRVTDADGKVYEQNRSILCYDTEKPTVAVSLSDGVLTIQGTDAASGIASVTVNDTTYSSLDNGKLKIQLTQGNFTTKTLVITATDAAGNTSDQYTLQNPYYEWASNQSGVQGTGSGVTSTDTNTTSPLPQDAEASEPTEARGTVEERTVTGIEEELAESGEDAESITQTATEGTKEFYTISTKSGKIFYLVIDNSKSEDNVYFLTEASDKDLMNFTLSDTVTLPETDTVYAEANQQAADEVAEEAVDGESDEEPEEEAQMPEDQSPGGSYLLIALAAAGIFAGAYYFKIYKPQHEYDDDEYEEYEEYDDSGAEPETGEEAAEPDDADEDVLEDEEEEE